MKRMLVLLTILLTSTSLAQSVDLFYDKANWQSAFDETFQAAPEAVKSVPYADTSSYQAAVRSALRTPLAPGLFTWWSGYRMKDLVDAGLVADVSDIWQKYIDAGTYSPSLASAFSFDGKAYAIPNNLAYWVVFYNKKVFEENSLQVPTTWEELETVNATLKENGVTPFGQSVDGRWPAFIYFQEFMIRQDPDFYNRLMEGEAKYTDPEVAQVFATWQEWIDAGYFSDPTIGFGTASTGAQLGSEMAQGNIAMAVVGSWYADTIVQAGLPEDQIGTFIMPNETADLPKSVIFEAGPILVAENSRQKEAALKDADYWMSAPAQQTWIDAMNFPPINSDTTSKSELISAMVGDVNQGDYTLINRFWEATPPDIAEAAVDEIARFMLQQAPAEQVMQNLQSIADQYWAAN